MKKFDENKELVDELEFERGWCDQVSWVAPGRFRGSEDARGVPGAGARGGFSSGGGFVRWRFFLYSLGGRVVVCCVCGGGRFERPC